MTMNGGVLRRRIAGWLLICGSATACMGQDGGDSDSETHFACRDDGDCERFGPGWQCDARVCAESSTEGNVPDATTAGGGGGGCDAPTFGREPPYAVEFRFTNDSGLPLALAAPAGADMSPLSSLSACSDGYGPPIGTGTLEMTGCTSEPCSALVVGPTPLTAVWSGYLMNDGEPAPAGWYRYTVAVYHMREDGSARVALYVKSVDFALPDEDGVVDVRLDDSPYIAPCPEGGSERCIQWVGVDSAAAGCTPDPMATCPGGGTRYECNAAVPIDPSCTSGNAYGPDFIMPGSVTTAQSARVYRCCD